MVASHGRAIIHARNLTPESYAAPTQHGLEDVTL